MQTAEARTTDLPAASRHGKTAAGRDDSRGTGELSAAGCLRRNLRLAMALAVLGALSLPLDLRVAALCPELSPYNLWAQLWTIPELFGDGLGILLIVCVVFLACRESRPRLPRVLACAFLTGALASLLKPAVLRVRPRALDEAESVWDTFHGSCLWSPWTDPDFAWSSAMTSFPSSHTTAAVGFALGLAWLWPNWRVVFGCLAAAVAAQRIVVGAHFLSDTLWGAALALIVASLCLDRAFLGKWFDKFEYHWARRFSC